MIINNVSIIHHHHHAIISFASFAGGNWEHLALGVGQGHQGLDDVHVIQGLELVAAADGHLLMRHLHQHLRGVAHHQQWQSELLLVWDLGLAGVAVYEMLDNVLLLVQYLQDLSLGLDRLLQFLHFYCILIAFSWNFLLAIFINHILFLEDLLDGLRC